MRKRPFYVFSIIFFFVVRLQADTINSHLRQKLQQAMEDAVLLEVTTDENQKYVGKITEIAETNVVLLNPLSEKVWTLPVASINRIKQIRPLKHIVESYLRNKRLVSGELIDGSVVKGKVILLGTSHFLLQDPKSGEETRIEYGHLKTFPKEPEGQRIIRNAMIGAGVGLGAALTLLVIIIRGD